MQYRLREKVWSLRNRFFIRDVEGADLFRVEGKLVSFGRKLTVFDLAGDECARIEQKVFTWRPTYFLQRAGEATVRVRRMLLPIFKSRVLVDAPGMSEVEVRGNLWAHEYEFLRDGQTIGRASKKVFSWADDYLLEFDDAEDQLMLLCTTVIIDLIGHDGDGGGAAAGA